MAKSYSDEYIDFVKPFDSSDEFLYECAGKGIAFLTGKAIDDAVVRFLDVMGTPKDVVETTVVKAEEQRRACCGGTGNARPRDTFLTPVYWPA